jgi:hypothetical protein
MSPVPELDSETRNRSLSSFDNVGRTKAVGYLPKSTIVNVLGQEVDACVKNLILRGLKAQVFDEHESCIKSGAVFAYEPKMVSKIIKLHKDRILKRGWLLTPESVIGKLSAEWYDNDDQIMPLIRNLFNDPDPQP